MVLSSASAAVKNHTLIALSLGAMLLAQAMHLLTHETWPHLCSSAICIDSHSHRQFSEAVKRKVSREKGETVSSFPVVLGVARCSSDFQAPFTVCRWTALDSSYLPGHSALFRISTWESPVGMWEDGWNT